MRYLAIDLGAKRTGLALGDDVTGLVQPLRVLEGMGQGDRLIEAVAKEVEGYGADALVVGLPLNMDGTEGGAAKSARQFAERAAARTGVEAHLQDERLTSAAADWDLAGSGLTHGGKKKVRDAMAAAEILRDFLRERGAG
ncbi:MAG: Holliday junction resolvase RuvX [Planctomycetota bacterium]|nr:Holliday junction resolvase RuvX [Planctomycetota bacterium]